MARQRRGWRAQMRDYNYVTSEMKRDAEYAKPRCGCSENKSEADPGKWPCPCGSHCPEHGDA